MELHLATKTGLVTVQQSDGTWQVINRALEGHFVTSVIAREGAVLAGTTQGLYASADNGQTWSEASAGLTIGHVRWLAYHPDVSDLEFAGTEPAGIFVSVDGGASWQERLEVTALRQRHKWWLPYSPEAGCVRGFAFHGKRAYAAVEVGAALCSDDLGQTWRLVGGSDGQPTFGRPPVGFLHPDVHSIDVHPSSPDLVVAPTGGGFYGSEDGGESWTALYADCYVRAVWRDPGDAAHMILGPSDSSSGRNGRIEETLDGGRRWHTVTERWSQNMVDRFIPVRDQLFAVMANGELFSTNLASLEWQPVKIKAKGINDLTGMA